MFAFGGLVFFELVPFCWRVSMDSQKEAAHLGGPQKIDMGTGVGLK